MYYVSHYFVVNTVFKEDNGRQMEVHLVTISPGPNNQGKSETHTLVRGKAINRL